MVIGVNKNGKIVSLNVRGIWDSTKRRGFFTYFKDQNDPSIFYKKCILKAPTKVSGETNGEHRFFSLMVVITADVYAS